MRQTLTVIKKAHILHPLRQGKSLRAVSAEVGCSPSTVHAIRKQHSDPTPASRTGRPRSLTPRELTHIGRFLVKKEIRSASEARRMVQELFQKKVHLSTVCRSLHTIGMRAVVKKKKPLLLPYREVRGRLRDDVGMYVRTRNGRLLPYLRLHGRRPLRRHPSRTRRAHADPKGPQTGCT